MHHSLPAVDPASSRPFVVRLLLGVVIALIALALVAPPMAAAGGGAAGSATVIGGVGGNPAPPQGSGHHGLPGAFVGAERLPSSRAW